MTSILIAIYIVICIIAGLISAALSDTYSLDEKIVVGVVSALIIPPALLLLLALALLPEILICATLIFIFA